MVLRTSCMPHYRRLLHACTAVLPFLNLACAVNTSCVCICKTPRHFAFKHISLYQSSTSLNLDRILSVVLKPVQYSAQAWCNGCTLHTTSGCFVQINDTAAAYAFGCVSPLAYLCTQHYHYSTASLGCEVHSNVW